MKLKISRGILVLFKTENSTTHLWNRPFEEKTHSGEKFFSHRGNNWKLTTLALLANKNWKKNSASSRMQYVFHPSVTWEKSDPMHWWNDMIKEINTSHVLYWILTNILIYFIQIWCKWIFVSKNICLSIWVFITPCFVASIHPERRLLLYHNQHMFLERQFKTW